MRCVILLILFIGNIIVLLNDTLIAVKKYLADKRLYAFLTPIGIENSNRFNCWCITNTL